MFCNFRDNVSSPSEKVFEKKSYISYTHTSNILYLLAFSDEGLGEGFCARV